jgi:hypothetical protein
MTETLKLVKEKLQEQHGYDFDSEFWTDENLVMFQEIVEATGEVINYDLNGIEKH